MSVDNYSVVIRRIDDENGYEATVRELPDVAEFADTYSEAYELAWDAIHTTAEIMAEKGKVMPPAQAIIDDYSGRVTLRLPKTLHASYVKMSEVEGVSLNSLICSVLAGFKGFDAAMHATVGEWYDVNRSSLKVKRHARIVNRSPHHMVIGGAGREYAEAC